MELTWKGRERILRIIESGGPGRMLSRALVLKLKDKDYTNMEVADIVGVTPRTVINICNKYNELGFESALNDDPRSGRPLQFDERIKSQIVAMVCSDPPEGFDRWTLELIREQVINQGVTDSVSTESIRIILRENDLKPWQEKMWCIPFLDDEYIERMEDVLEVYEKGYDPNYPVVCLDEKPVALFEDKRAPLLLEPGRVLKKDYEYKRNGSVNVFCAVEPLVGRYFNRVTDNRKGPAFAKYLATIERKYRNVKKIVLVLDNLSTHTEKALIKYYGEKEGRRIWSRFEVHYTPKHGSWLNQAEIAIGMYSRQCLGHSRIGDIDTLRIKTKKWNKIANRKKVVIKWRFTIKDAQKKFNYK